jgi:hypothetical protein
MGHDRSYQKGSVRVTRHFLDWSQMGPGFGEFAQLTYDRLCAIPSECNDHMYLNPAYSLTAPATVPETVFARQALRACILWQQQLVRWIGRGPVRRAVNRASPGERGLVFSGMLFLAGRPVHIKRLNELVTSSTVASC